MTRTNGSARKISGAIVAGYAADLPGTLNTRATAIHWAGLGVRVDTSNGTLAARAVIVTVSIGVLAAGVIRFNPPPPPQKQEAIAGITMGDYNHITLQFDADIFGLGIDSRLLHHVDESMVRIRRPYPARVAPASPIAMSADRSPISSNVPVRTPRSTLCFRDSET